MRYLKENPDTIKELPGKTYFRHDNDAPRYGDVDSIPFTLFEKFYLYSLHPGCTHGMLTKHLIEYIRYEIPDPDAIYQHKGATKSYSDKYKIKSVGSLTQDEIEKVKFLNPSDVLNHRNSILHRLPRAIQGRLWRGDEEVKTYGGSSLYNKVISFWNDPSSVHSRKNSIIDFIRLFGDDPEHYMYELGNGWSQYTLYTYKDFISGRYNEVNMSFKNYMLESSHSKAASP